LQETEGKKGRKGREGEGRGYYTSAHQYYYLLQALNSATPPLPPERSDLLCIAKLIGRHTELAGKRPPPDAAGGGA